MAKRKGVTMGAPSRWGVWLALAGVFVVGCDSTAPEEARPQPVPSPGLEASPGPKLPPALVPPLVLDLSVPSDGSLQTAILAGGCFWGVEAVFDHLKGVVDVVSGYSGGTAETAIYELVVFGTTTHAEVVEVHFDPTQISYGQILRVYFSVAHDPTQVDRQGPDVGPHYRSNIFFGDEAQGNVARAYVAQLAGAFSRPIATRIDPLEAFYPAEDYHQDFLVKNPSDPYIVKYNLPLLVELQRMFPDLYRS